MQIHSAPKSKPQDSEIIPWFTTGLLKFGLITQEQADAAYAEWEAVDGEEVRKEREWWEMMAKMAWDALPTRKRLFRSGFLWQRAWLGKHRPW
jgi:hypothetical protein